MADKTDDLVISVSTDMTTVQRALRKLDADIGVTAGTIQKRFSAMGQGIDKSMTTALQARINDMVGIGTKGAKEWTGVLAEQGKEFERLRTKINPVFGVINRYKASVVEIQTAHRIGAVSADEMTSAIQRERQAALASIAAIKQRNSALADTPARGGSFNTANIAAQFQDIGVTAAMGMSPIQIALQQGTQLSAVFEQMKANGQSAGSALLGAFTSIISPISLVTIGLVAAGAAAAQYFMSTGESAKSLDDAISDHAKAIADLRKAYGIASEGADDYARRSNAAIESAARRAAASLRDAIANEEKAAKSALSDTGGFSGFGLLQRFGLLGDGDLNAVKAQFAAFSEPIKKLRDEINAGKPDYEAFEQSLRNIASTDPQNLGPIADKILGITDKATDGRAELDGLTESLNGLTQSQIDTANIIAQINGIEAAANAANYATGALKRMLDGMGPGNGKGDAVGGPAAMDRAQSQFREMLNLQRRLNPEAFPQVKAPTAPKAARAPRRTADDRFFEDIEAIKARTVALAEEQAQLGMSYEAQTKRKVAFDLEQKALRDVREEARKKGDQDWQNAQLSPDQIAKIDEVSDAYARQAQALRDAQVRQQDFQDWMNVGRDATRGFIDDLLNGASAGEAFANVLGKIGDKLLDLAMNDLFGGGNGGGTGLLGALLGGLGGGGSSSSPLSWLDDMFRADGGPVQAGQPYIVGEKRPELFVPRASGTIIPQVPRLQSAANDNGTTFAPVYHIDARGADAAAVARLEAGLNKTNREMQARIESGVRSAQQRNVKLGR